MVARKKEHPGDIILTFKTQNRRGCCCGGGVLSDAYPVKSNMITNEYKYYLIEYDILYFMGVLKVKNMACWDVLR